MQCFHSFSPLVLICSSSAWNREPSSRGASKKCDLTSADSGLQLDLKIALGGVSAKIQPLRLIQPCRRRVETSGDVINEASTWSATVCRALILRARELFPADARRDNGRKFIVSADEKLTAFLELESQVSRPNVDLVVNQDSEDEYGPF